MADRDSSKQDIDAEIAKISCLSPAELAEIEIQELRRELKEANEHLAEWCAVTRKVTGDNFPAPRAMGEFVERLKKQLNQRLN